MNTGHQKTKKETQPSSVKPYFCVKFWGVRGTVPTPNPLMSRYGGNTSCIEIKTPSFSSEMLLFDAGTGIIAAGEQALKNKIQTFHIFLTHMHFDHIIGLMHFMPFYRKDCTIHIYGESKGELSLEEIFKNLFRAPFFPVEFKNLPCLSRLHFHPIVLKNRFLMLEDLKVEYLRLNHPQESLAYKIWNAQGDKNVAYVTDHEHGSERDSDLVEFIRDSHLFIYDSTFSSKNYEKCVGWGHSTSTAGASFAQRAQVKKYAIFHHDPASTDEYLEKTVLSEAQNIFKKSFLAQEGLEVNLLASSKG